MPRPYTLQQAGDRRHSPLRSPFPSRLRQTSKQRWPPRPQVEEEEISLSKEHKAFHLLKHGSDVPLRGTIDQQPILLEADGSIPVDTRRSKEQSDQDHTSLRSRSSSESLGPQTPPESVNLNQDRRYVYIPQEGIEIPLTYDEKKPHAAAPVNRQKNDTRNDQPPKQISSVKTRPPAKSVQTAGPVMTPRERSPYTHTPSHTPSTSKSHFSGDYLMSPASLSSPDTRFPESPKTSSPRHRLSMNSPRTSDDYKKTAFSASASFAERPPMHRHMSAVPFTEGTLPHPINTKPRYKSVSSDSPSSSDSDSDSAVRPRKQRIDTASFKRPTHPRQTSAVRYDEAMHQSQKSASPTIPSLPHHLGRADPRQAQSPITKNKEYLRNMHLPPIPHTTSSVLPLKVSPNVSPSTSPCHSPPRSPRAEADRSFADSLPALPGARRSKPNSRPASPSPLHPAQDLQKSIGLGIPFDSHQRTVPKPRSRQTSPLPSPGAEQPGSRSGPPIAIQSSSPAGKPAYMASMSDRMSRSPSGERVPSAQHPRPSSRLGDSVPRPRATSGADLKKRLSSEIKKTSTDTPRSPSLPNPKVVQLPKQSVPLPACPRPNFVAGYNDWFTLAGLPSFDICPSCRDAITANGYGASFTPAPPRPPGYETRCDFSLPWVRMAWLLTVKDRLPNVNLLYSIAEVIAREPACPGKAGYMKQSYRVYDAESGKTISGFDICPCCVRSLETIFPRLRGVFQPKEHKEPLQLSACDLRADSNRFATYVDLLEEIATQSEHYRRPPNMLRFVQLVQKMSAVRECSRDDMVIGQPWHFIPHLPEFSVCEECYDEVIWPAIRDGSPLAAEFNRSLQTLPPSPMGSSCQLYSTRMREVWKEACRRNDFYYLRNKAMERFVVERDLQAKHVGFRTQGYDSAKGVEEVKRLVEEWKRWE
ncbi:hypothetical protein MMC09_006104 [Bachmanniomyces sp. S44760]|nr:hypothetical protein [Bachmanniomyces sp. S44760]